MTQLFLNLLNMGFAAGWIVLAVLLLRPVMRKLPRWIHCILWGIAGLRLVLPVFPVSVISLLPSSQTVPLDLAVSENPAVQTGMATVNTAVNTMLAQQTSEDLLTGVLEVAGIVWAIGAAALLIYACIVTVRLRIQVRASLLQSENIYVCDYVDSPFIFGMLRPRIYLPSDLDPMQTEHVLAHEKAHLRRLDHLWKPIGFLLLAIYWFHPLLWVAYILLCRDIEQACDEKVISKKDGLWRKSYSETLASCSAHRRLVVFCPVAFGELGVKDRIKGVLSYKKPALWIIVAAVICCSALAAGFLTDPLPCIHSYESAITCEPSCTQEGVETFTCSKCQDWYTEPVALLPHNYGNGEVSLPPTCTNEGVYQESCMQCGQVRQESISIVPHTAGETFVYAEPNCTDTGLLASYCTVCAELFIVERLAPNGVHELLETVTVAATCTEEGSGILACSRCDYSERCTYQKLPHCYVEGPVSYPNCWMPGWQKISCAQCGDFYFERVNPTGHTFQSVAGKRYSICSICGYTGGLPLDLTDNTVGFFPSSPVWPVVRIWP